MKKRFFQKNLNRNRTEIASRARRLSLESLEGREMLNADWGGFAPEVVSEYEPQTLVYSVDLSENPANVCDLQDMNGDDVDELLVVNYTAQSLTVYQNDGSGKFERESTTTLAGISAGNSAVVFADVVGNDGIADAVVVTQSQSALGLTATIYKGASDFTFAQTTTKSLDVSAFGDGLLFGSIDAALVADGSGGFDLVAQGSVLSVLGMQPRTTVVYAGVGSTDFGQKGTLLNISGSASTDDPVLAGSATIDETTYVVSIDKTSPKSNNLVLTDNSGSAPVNYTADLSSVGVVVAEWVLERDGVLVVGGTLGGESGILTVKITDLTAGEATFASKWTECEGLALNAASCAAIGNMGGSEAAPEIFAANGSAYVVYRGTASENYGFEFTQEKAVVTNPEYNSITVRDVDGDGATEALIVGASQIWIADVAEDGSLANLATAYAFDRTVKKAVFGDFNGDGLTDVAVYYQASGSSTVGTNVQLFQQVSERKFVPIASCAVSSFCDFAVGRVSQTAVDELVVLNQTAKTGAQYVKAYKLNVSATSTYLSATRSVRFDSSFGLNSLSVGAIYGASVDDVVAISSANGKITILKNDGKSTFTSKTVDVATSLQTTACNPTAVAIGDVDKDGKNDLVVLNAASGDNRAHLAYLLQTDAGWGKATSKTELIIDGLQPTGLALADFDGDGNLDALTVQTTTTGASYLWFFAGSGDSTAFKAGKRMNATSVGLDSAYGFCVAKVDGNATSDVVLARGKKVGVFLNTNAAEASGSVRFVCRSASDAAATTFAADVAAERTWIDEWSNFYLDVWATTGESGSVVSSATAALKYNPAYFAVAGVEAAIGFGVTSAVENGVVTATATATATGTPSADGWTLVARIRFEPVSQESDGKKVYVGGVAIPTDGVLTSVANGFAADASAQKVDGSAVETAVAPTGLALYPANCDLNDDGKVNSTDFAEFVEYFMSETSEIPEADAKYRICDYNGDGKINATDFSYFTDRFNVSANGTADSYYSEAPVATVSGAVLESLDAPIVESNGAEFELVAPGEVASAASAREDAATDEAFGEFAIESENVSVDFGDASESAFDFASFDADEFEYAVDLDVELDVRL